MNRCLVILSLMVVAMCCTAGVFACPSCVVTWQQGIALSAEFDKPTAGASFCPGEYIDYGLKNIVGDDLRITDCGGNVTVEHVGECETYEWTITGGELVPRTPFVGPKWHLPCTPGTYMIKVKIVDHQCDGYDGWYDDQDIIELSRTIEVVPPIHEATWMIPPPGPVGATFRGVIQTQTKCAELLTDWSLSIRKTGTSDPWIPAGVAEFCYRPPAVGCCVAPLSEPGVTECQYLVTGFTVNDPCGPPSQWPPLNGSYDTRLTFTYTPCNGCGTPVEQHLDGQIGISNLVVADVQPDDHVTWDGTDVSSPITVTLTDNDLTDLMDVKLDIYSCAEGAWVKVMGDPAWSWSKVRTMEKVDVTGGSHQFNWDGKDDNGQSVAPGVYTYEVTVTQHDVDPGADLPEHLRTDPNVMATLSRDDCASYRSRFLRAERANDENGDPIYDAEYYGYDDNGTPNDDSDDNYLYLLRTYILRDSDSKNAHSGQLQFYGHSLQLKQTWNVASLQCVAHSMQCDGLTASASGTEHSLLVPVPATYIEELQDGEDGRLVLHVVDDHAEEYRDNQRRPALDLNQRVGANCDGLVDFSITGPSVVDDPDSLSSCISGAPFRIIARARRSGGTTASNFVGAVDICADTANGGRTVLATATFRKSDSGTKTITGLLLRTIFGTDPTRSVYVRSRRCNVESGIDVAVWFSVVGTREGLVGEQTAYGHIIEERDHFVALPAGGLAHHPIYVRRNQYLEDTTVEDVGPHHTNDPYWNTTGTPQAEGESGNHAGIDLADGTFWDALHMTDNGNVLWRFH
jgi:hypothetical protein